MHKFAKFIYFRLMGWSLNGTFPTHVKKCVVAVVPHTSWWDFPLGIILRNVWNVKINFVGKKSLFKAPFGWYFRWMGGAPVDRTKNSDTVTATAEIFKTRDTFRLTLAPEGTRKKVTKLKSGFYYIAKKAEVPIVLIAFDFGKKEVKVSDPLWPTEDAEADFQTYEAFFEGVKGKVAEYSF